jgi:selenocysteine lyase/cysteine desulfurase
LCSTFGAAVCYLCPGVLADFRPPLVGWRSTEHPWSVDARWLPLAATARRMEYSTMSYAAVIALGRAIGYIRGLSLAEVAAHTLLGALLQQQRRRQQRSRDTGRGAALTFTAQRASQRSAAVTIAPATESTVNHARKHQSRAPAQTERSIAGRTLLL